MCAFFFSHKIRFPFSHPDPLYFLFHYDFHIATCMLTVAAQSKEKPYYSFSKRSFSRENIKNAPFFIQHFGDLRFAHLTNSLVFFSCWIHTEV